MIIFTFCRLSSFAGGAGGGCTPAANTACGSATSLSIGSACVNGTTCGGTAPVSTTCTSTQTAAVWYSFTATSTFLAVVINSVSGNCYFSSGVFSGSCGSLTQLSCQTGAPLNDSHGLLALL